MSKVTAPLLSFGAAGQIGGTQVYASWRGIPYARKHVIPSNPQSAGQTKTRNVFAWASSVWKQSGTIFRAPWNAASAGQPFTNRNLWIGKNTKAMRLATDLSLAVWSPGNGGALPPLTGAVTPTAGTLTGATTNPTAPSGYTLAGAVLVATLAGNPQALTAYLSYGAEDTATYNAPVLSDLPAGDYVWGLYLHWTKSGGAAAYSTAISGASTVT